MYYSFLIMQSSSIVVHLLRLSGRRLRRRVLAERLVAGSAGDVVPLVGHVVPEGHAVLVLAVVPVVRLGGGPGVVGGVVVGEGGVGNEGVEKRTLCSSCNKKKSNESLQTFNCVNFKA